MEPCHDDEECGTEPPTQAKCVGTQAIKVACSLVKTLLEQLCKFHLIFQAWIDFKTYTLMFYLSCISKSHSHCVLQYCCFSFFPNSFTVFICILNKKSFLINHEGGTKTASAPTAENQSTALYKFANLHATVIRSPGEIVSLTLLNQTGTFRRNVDGYSGKALMCKVASSFEKLCFFQFQSSEITIYQCI